MLFRETDILYTVSLIAGLIFWIAFLGNVYGFLLLSICLLWFVLCSIVTNKITRKKLDKLERIIDDNCNIAAYIEFYEKNLYPKRHRLGIHNNEKLDLTLRLSNAYLYIGDTKSAMHVLSEWMFLKRKRIPTAYEFCYHNNLFICHLLNNDLSAAEQCLIQMEQALNDPKLRKSYRQLYADAYHKKQLLFNMAKGDDTGCENAFEQAYKNSTSTLNKVAAKYTLGKIYLHQNKMDEAIETFTYAVRHGGNSRYAIEASAQLEQLGEPVPISLVEKKNIKLFSRTQTSVGIIVLALLCALAGFSVVQNFRNMEDVNWEAIWLEGAEFYPTIEEAFEAHPFAYHFDRQLGEILFIDEQERSLSILHKANDEQLHLSHFAIEVREEGVFYACLSPTGVGQLVTVADVPDGTDMTSIDSYRRYLASLTRRAGVLPPIPRPEWAIGRRTLAGFANDEQIFALSINGQPVDYVLDLGTAENGQPLFFWYFSDVQILHSQNLRYEDVLFSLE